MGVMPTAPQQGGQGLIQRAGNMQPSPGLINNAAGFMQNHPNFAANHPHMAQQLQGQLPPGVQPGGPQTPTGVMPTQGQQNPTGVMPTAPQNPTGVMPTATAGGVGSVAPKAPPVMGGPVGGPARMPPMAGNTATPIVAPRPGV